MACEINVDIGETKVGKSGDMLSATLGSCVGIAFIWKEKGIFGLAHCLIPEGSESASYPDTKYIDQAIPSLMALLKIRSEDTKNIEVYVAGAASKPQSNASVQNSDAAKNYLRMNGFKIKEQDLGGRDGRQMFVDCTSGNVLVFTLQDSI